jgi:predicted nucleic acid-binding protein
MNLLDRVTITGAFAPSLWPLEALNGLLVAQRRKRIHSALRQRFADFLRALPITVDHETADRAWTDTVGLANRFRLSVYDAAYLELAQRRRPPLATLDQELIKAAKASGTTVLGT